MEAILKLEMIIFGPKIWFSGSRLAKSVNREVGTTNPGKPWVHKASRGRESNVKSSDFRTMRLNGDFFTIGISG